MTKRERVTVLICFLLLTIGTTIILWRQDANFNEHKRLDRNVETAVDQECTYAKENRQLLAQVLTDLSRGSFLDAASQQRLVAEAAIVQNRIDELKC